MTLVRTFVSRRRPTRAGRRFFPTPLPSWSRGLYLDPCALDKRAGSPQPACVRVCPNDPRDTTKLVSQAVPLLMAQCFSLVIDVSRDDRFKLPVPFCPFYKYSSRPAQTRGSGAAPKGGTCGTVEKRTIVCMGASKLLQRNVCRQHAGRLRWLST